MTEEEKKALINLINWCMKDKRTGNIQINFGIGKAGTVQFFDSYKMDDFLEKFGDQHGKANTEC